MSARTLATFGEEPVDRLDVSGRPSRPRRHSTSGNAAGHINPIHWLYHATLGYLHSCKSLRARESATIGDTKSLSNVMVEACEKPEKVG